MSDYFIETKNSNVCVSRIINGELEAIKIDGDIQIALYPFWSLFKEKIEYESGEKLAFIVVADDESFNIDADIAIAERFNATTDDLNALIFERLSAELHLKTYPDLDFNRDEIIPKRSIVMQTVEPEPKFEIEGESLQSFFKKKTRDIQREDRKVTGGR